MALGYMLGLKQNALKVISLYNFLSEWIQN